MDKSTNQPPPNTSSQSTDPEAMLSTNRGAFLGFLMKRLKDRLGVDKTWGSSSSLRPVLR